MRLRPPRAPRTATLFSDTTLFRSMVDEESGRIGNHVRQFGQTRTHSSGGKLWFGGRGVEPFDAERRINLFAPIAGDLPNHQFFGSWLQLPPIAGIVSRALRAQDHVEIAFGVELQILEIRIDRKSTRLNSSH